MTRIFVDADACPVRKEVQKVAQRFGLKTIMVSNGGIRPSRDPMVEIIIVPAGADAADDRIERDISTGDIVVTQDIVLAARCWTKGVGAVGPTGKEFTDINIGMSLGMRELNQHLRETGMGGGFNASFQAKDRSRFLQVLDLMVRRLG